MVLGPTERGVEALEQELGTLLAGSSHRDAAIRVAGEIEGDADGPAIAGDGEDPRALAREGLLNLGYTPPEAEKLLSGADGASPEEIVQSALRSATGAA